MYDARQRIVSSTVGTEVTAYEYWPNGLLKKTTRPDGSYLLQTYDAAHRLVGLQDGLGNSISFTLDAAGNRISEQVRDPLNVLFRTRSWVYDNLGRLSQEIGAVGQAVGYEYDDAGNRIATTDPWGACHCSSTTR